MLVTWDGIIHYPMFGKWSGSRERAETFSEHCRGAFEQCTEMLVAPYSAYFPFMLVHVLNVCSCILRVINISSLGIKVYFYCEHLHP